jgi:hypothetical protein
MLSPKFAWNDYFTGTPETTLGPGQYSSRQTPSAASVHVSNCLFNKCTVASGDGGALCCTAVTYFLVELSSFLSCKTNSGVGGAIYFYNTGSGQSALFALCGNDCCSTGTGQFASISINNAASNKNCANFSSINRCMDENPETRHTLNLQNGKIYCPSVNISMNKCKFISGILCTPFVDSNSVMTSLLYSTFANNSASERSCIWCNNGGTKYEIKCCNVLRNAQVNYNSCGTIFARGNLMIEDSCILENTAACIFYQESSSYTITLSNCTVDSTSKYGTVITQKTVTKSFIHGLNHLSTQNCHAQYDSAGTLTAIPYVLQSTKKTFCYYYKCHTNHCQARISDSFPLIYLFIVTFIYPNPSDNCWYDSCSFL